LTLAFLWAAVTRWGSFDPWRLIFELFPGASAIRAVGRVHLAMALPASILLAWGADEIGRKLASWKPGIRSAADWLAALLVTTALFEQFGGPPCSPGFSASAERAWMSQLASRIPAGTDAFYLTVPGDFPASSDQLSVDALGAAVLTGVPTLNGYSGIDPPGWKLHWLKRPEYKFFVERWREEHNLTGNIAELRIGGGDEGREKPAK
jgi:hypothetical protein